MQWSGLWLRRTSIYYSTIDHLPIGNEKPRAKQRGAFLKPYSISLKKDSPSCLADCFSWPQVALTHHVCSGVIETSRSGTVKHSTRSPLIGLLCQTCRCNHHNSANCNSNPGKTGSAETVAASVSTSTSSPVTIDVNTPVTRIDATKPTASRYQGTLASSRCCAFRVFQRDLSSITKSGHNGAKSFLFSLH